MLDKFGVLLRITRSHHIARRYFFVNGFDGALTLLGLITGFYISEPVDLPVVINASLGVAIALGMSGMSSAYISEAAEKQRELRELEEAMITDLGESTYGQATRLLPFVIALVNGLAPFVIALVIIAPLWVAQGVPAHWPFGPLLVAMAVALMVVFLMGIYLGRISGTFWLWAGMRTLFVAAVTVVLIILVTPHTS